MKEGLEGRKLGSGVFGREALGASRVSEGFLAKQIENTTLKLDDQAIQKWGGGRTVCWNLVMGVGMIHFL